MVTLIVTVLTTLIGDALGAPMVTVKTPPTLKSWLAYRVKRGGRSSTPGVIYAWTEQEALDQAYAIFRCTTALERKRVYVRETS